MQDKSINNALLALRAQIYRQGGEGMEHVEALLALRGVPLQGLRSANPPNIARRGGMRLIVVDALRAGHHTQAEVTAYVAARRPELDASAAYKRTALCLARLRRCGIVSREGRKWKLAP